MIINTSSLLSFLEPKLNPSLKSSINNLSLNGKIELSDVLKDKSLQGLINNLFKDILQGLKTKTNVNELLKNSKNLLDLKNIPNDLKEISSKIANNPKLNSQSTIVNEFLKDIKNINDKTLKSNINNSGVFLESKLLKNAQNPSIDLKAALLQISELLDEPLVQKVISQIEYNQLLSYTSYSNNTFLPFIWDNIEDGNIEISSNEKEQFTCNIDLNLKNYGVLKAMLLLEKKDKIYINMRIENKNFKEKIQNNLHIVRQRFNKIGLNLQSLNILDYIDSKDKSYEEQAYKNINTLDLGLDIKA